MTAHTVRNGVMTGAFVLCLALAVASWPSPLPAIFTKQTPATFEFTIHVNTPAPKNQSFLAGNGTISLNAKGGLAVDNPIDVTVNLKLLSFNNSGLRLAVFAQGMTFRPAYAYRYPLASLPKLAVIPLTTNPAKQDEASGSATVEFFQSGTLVGHFNASRIGAVFPNGTAMFLKTNFEYTIPSLFQVSPPDVAVASDNGAYTIALTWVVIGLSFLTLRKED